VLFLRCEDHELAPGYELQATLSVGEVTAHETICREDVPLWDAEEQARFWDSTGIGVGEPVTVTARLTAARHQVDGAAPELGVPEQGTFAAAVAEVVPFEEYPLPAAPSAPAPLPEPASAGVVARADSSDPLAPVEVTFRWDAGLAGRPGRRPGLPAGAGLADPGCAAGVRERRGSDRADLVGLPAGGPDRRAVPGLRRA